ncbi:MAG: TIGR03960 family B12-binding radical SAM protein [Clostridia bacterium]|nr:TIGR03960 family B12-binding radical SAM protein [Clostridia bacterium]
MDKNLEKQLLSVQKPASYTGNEQGAVYKDKNAVDVRFAFCFPDKYEIGMSHIGMKILYGLINERDDAWCERVFAPAEDMERVMREGNFPLFGLESGEPIKDFDIIGFTLMYELCYTNVLNMLDLAGLPVRAKDRTSLSPLVVAGGPCCCNAEPMAEFIDLFMLGDGEDVMNELIDLYKKYRQNGGSKADFLEEASHITGVYVPSLYDVQYNADGTIRAVTPQKTAPAKATKANVADLDKVYYPTNFVVPYTEIVFDRAVHEIFRGCIRGCRFCQAGFIYRPIREKRPETVSEQSRALCEATGYDELSLCSLSSSDYTHIKELLNMLLDWTEPRKINIALPSLRIDNFDRELLERLSAVRKSGLTFAPEAGTQRLRDVINKNITEEEILNTSREAFAGGRTAVKLYFMIGLPTETDEDVKGIAELAQKVVNEFYRNPDKPKGKGVQVSVSASNFVPKPFTPFQWEPQDAKNEFVRKQEYLRSCVTTKKVTVSCHTPAVSALEGVMARGDRRLADAIEYAWRHGCTFDSWEDSFDYEKWLAAFEATGLDPAFYANRRRDYGEILPWDHLDYGVDKSFLMREAEKSKQGETTPHCRVRCAGCGANKLNGGHCDARRQTDL